MARSRTATWESSHHSMCYAHVCTVSISSLFAFVCEDEGRHSYGPVVHSNHTQRVFKVVLQKSIPTKSVNLFFILVMAKDKLTNSWGGLLLQNGLENTLCQMNAHSVFPRRLATRKWWNNDKISHERGIKWKSFSNEVHHTNSSILLLKNMLCSNLDCQKGFDAISFSYEIWRWPVEFCLGFIVVMTKRCEIRSCRAASDESRGADRWLILAPWPPMAVSGPH